jgi:hypothetical protein
MADTEPRTETRSSEVGWSRLLDAVDPGRLTVPEPAYQFSNGRTFVQPKSPYGENA